MNSTRIKLYPNINCCFNQVHRQRYEEVSGLHHYYTYAETIVQDSSEELNQNYDDMSCVNGFKRTTGTTFHTHI